MKLTMDTSVIGGNFLRIKSDFVWVRLLNPKLNIILKLIEINGCDLFMKDQVDNLIVLWAIWKSWNSLLL